MTRLIYYRDQSGREPLNDWLTGLRDVTVNSRVRLQLYRLGMGNPGDVRSVGGGVMEMRIHFSPGYRLYYAPHGDAMILLLCAGTKRTQQADIRRAQSMWQEWKRRGS